MGPGRVEIDQISNDAAQELRRLGEQFARDVLARAEANLSRGRSGEHTVKKEAVISASPRHALPLTRAQVNESRA